jgi:hypothetical protein
VTPPVRPEFTGPPSRAQIERARIRRNVEKMQAGGAGDDEIEHYLRDIEGLQPTGDTAAPPSSPSPKPPALGAVIHGLSQGLTLGFGDEAIAGAKALFGPNDFKTDYAKNVAEIRGLGGRYETERPALTTTANIAGALAPAVVSGGASVPTTLPRAIARGAATGAAFGGLTAAGRSEGGIGERAKAAVPGALVGGVLGGAVPVVAAGARKGADALRNLRGPSTPEAVDETAQLLLQRGLDRSGQSVDDLRAAASSAVPGKPLTLLDLGGRGVDRVARGVATAPGKGSADLMTTLSERSAGAPERAVADLRAGFGREGADVAQLIDDIIAKRSAEASPHFDAFRALGDLGTHEGDDLANLLAKSKDIRTAIGSAKGLPEYADLPDTHASLLHKAYKYVGDLAQSAKRAGEAERYRDLTVLQNQFRDALSARSGGEASPLLAGNRIFSGESAIKDAAELGRDLVSKNADARMIQKAVAAMSAGERDAFSVGAQDALELAARKTGDASSVVSRIFGSPEKRALVQAVFPDAQAYQSFAERMAAEKLMGGKAGGLLRQSMTADKGLDVADLSGIGPDDILSAIIHPKATAAKAGIGALTRRLTGQNEAVRDRLAQYLTLDPKSPGFSSLADALELLAQRGRTAAGGGRVARTLPALFGEEAGFAAGARR